MNDSSPKPPCHSAVQTRYLVMPNHANPGGTVFGGVILSWIDMIASMAAQRHCHIPVVTASIDGVSFREPINIGDHVVLKASVNYTHRTSMEVGVKVFKEDPVTGESTHTTTAYVTFVAVDERHKPVPVPPVKPANETEKRRWEQARQRAEHRRKMRERNQSS